MLLLPSSLLLLLTSFAWATAPAPISPARIATPLRVYLDAGHGAPGNTGNQDAACRAEETVMLAVAEHVAAGLQGTGRYQVQLSRTGDQRPDYNQRLAAARDFEADLFVSLHSDARGMGTPVVVDGRSCHQNKNQPGFSILWSDEGDLAQARLALARELALSMIANRFPVYDGFDYGGLYEADAQTPGVFVDRHIPRQRIRFLRRPVMPSVIIETHHAWHPDEAEQWQRTETWDRLVTALDTALHDWPR